MASKFMRGSSVPTMVTRYAAAKGRMPEVAVEKKAASPSTKKSEKPVKAEPKRK